MMYSFKYDAWNKYQEKFAKMYATKKHKTKQKLLLEVMTV